MAKHRPLNRCTVIVPKFNRTKNDRKVQYGGPSLNDWEQRTMNNNASIFKVRLNER